MDPLSLVISTIVAATAIVVGGRALISIRTSDVSNMRAGALIIGPDRRCRTVIGQFRRMLELPANWDPSGREICQVISDFVARGDYGPRVKDAGEIDADWFLTSEFEEIYIDTPSGNVVGTSVAEHASGGWILTYTDMTRMKEQARILFRMQQDLAASEAKAQKLAKEADAANQAKSAFLAAMSHEIRTPMNGVIGMADLLAETELNKEQRTCVDTIGQSAQALLRIINDILDFSKIEAGKMSIDCAPLNLLSVIEDVLMLVSANAREKGLDLTMAYAPDLPQRLEGDALRLRQILINLIGNAIKFTEIGSVHVAVTGVTGSSQTQLVIDVTDTGIGIPQHDLARIFGEFDQVDQSSKRRFEGTGLGLAITRRLVSLMNGQISVCSELGIGTTFTVEVMLPVCQEDAAHCPCWRDKPEIGFVSAVEGERKLANAWFSAMGASVRAFANIELISDLVAPKLLIIDLTCLGDKPDAKLVDLRSKFPDAKIVLACWPNEERELADHTDISAQRLYKPFRVSQLLGLSLPEQVRNARPVGGRDARPRIPYDFAAVTVLIADDNKTNRLIAEKMLDQTGLDLHFACNGDEAIHLFRDVMPDLIFMDLSMPGTDGFEATRAIRDLENNFGNTATPIVALTANGADSERDRCIASGMTDFLTKPIAKDALFETIARYAHSTSSTTPSFDAVSGIRQLSEISARSTDF
ncbi:MAG: ATP-binding protein [Pseudomonadota bacterium]